MHLSVVELFLLLCVGFYAGFVFAGLCAILYYSAYLAPDDEEQMLETLWNAGYQLSAGVGSIDEQIVPTSGRTVKEG